MDDPSLTAAVRRELLAHADVTERPHRFGGIVFQLGRAELGHIHGETVADLPFPAPILGELLTSGRVSADQVDSESGWVSSRVSGPEDIAKIVELFRLSYEYAAAEAGRAANRGEHEEAAAAVDREPRARWRDVLALRPRPTLRRRSSRR